MWSMPSDRFFRFAERLTAYQGVMQMRADRESRRRQPASTGRAAAGRAGGAGDVTYHDDISQAPELLKYFGRKRG